MKIFQWETMSIIFAVLLSFCSRPQTDSSVVLAVGGAPSEIDFWEKVASRCSENTGINLKIVRQPTDTDQRRQNLVTALRAHKSTPDIFLMDVAWIAQFAASDWLQPLQPYMDSSTLSSEHFFAPVIEQVDTYGENLIALPVYVDGGLLYYRKDLLQKYGYSEPPSTWDQLISYASEICAKEKEHNPDFTGFVWQGAQYEGLVCTFLEFAGSNNGGLKLENTSSIFNNDQNKTAVQFMRDLIHLYRLSPANTFTDMKEEEVRLVFQNGNALFERNWPYAWKHHDASDSPVKGKTGVALLPHFQDGQSAATLGGWHIGMSRYSKNKQNAFKCISYLLSAEIQKEFAISMGWNPGRVDVYNDPEIITELPHASILRDVFNHAIARPAVPHYSYISSVLQRFISAVIAGKMDINEAFAQCEIELGSIISRYSQK